MHKVWTLHRWPGPDSDILCDFCHQEPAIGEMCADSVALWVIGDACWERWPAYDTNAAIPQMVLPILTRPGAEEG